MSARAAAEGRLTVFMAGVPAMTMQQIRIERADKAEGRHWSRGRCWGGASHGDGETALTLVAPPWDLARDGAVSRG